MAKTSTPSTPEPPAGVDFSAYKIPPRYVPSDDLVEEIDGQTYYPHKGEGVWVQPVNTVRIYLDVMQMLQAQAMPDEDSDQKAHALTSKYESLNTTLSELVAAWNWTGWDGTPLPQPHDHPEVIQRLMGGEIGWLQMVAKGELPSAEKNDGAPSGATSTDSDPLPEA